MRKTTGISLMLLIFLSLCLITFSLLSLSGALADEKLSQKAAERTTQYYQADTAANAVLSRIDACLAAYLKEAQKAHDPESAYLRACAGIMADIPEAAWRELPSSGTISFTVPVNDSQRLQAELRIVYPDDNDDTLYEITSWKTVNTGTWEADTRQNVLRPGAPTETELKE